MDATAGQIGVASAGRFAIERGPNALIAIVPFIAVRSIPNAARIRGTIADGIANFISAANTIA